MYHLYILKTNNSKLYIGHTEDLVGRIARHQSSDGARFLRGLENFELVYSEEYQNRSEAMRREKQLKGWTRAKIDEKRAEIASKRDGSEVK